MLKLPTAPSCVGATGQGMGMTETLLDSARLDGKELRVWAEPFAFLVAEGQLPSAAVAELDRHLPRYHGAGFFPFDPADCGDSVRRLVAELTAPAFANAIGARLGVPNLAGFPTLVTLCRSLNLRHGTIHTDSRSKVVTALLYLNADWTGQGAGCLRLLSRIDDIDALLVPEIPPRYGNLVAFRRADNSFHGHLPFAGERRVIQVAWLTSEAEKQRKTRRGRLSRLVKRLLGFFDRRLGAGRGRNASHPD